MTGIVNDDFDSQFTLSDEELNKAYESSSIFKSDSNILEVQEKVKGIIDLYVHQIVYTFMKCLDV